MGMYPLLEITSYSGETLNARSNPFPPKVCCGGVQKRGSRDTTAALHYLVKAWKLKARSNPFPPRKNAAEACIGREGEDETVA